MPDSDRPTTGNGIRPRLLALLILLSAIAPLSITAYLPALPQVSHELAIGPAAAQSTLTAFQLGLAIGQLLLGPLSDRLGRRRPLLIGTAVCALVSLACALAPNFESLVLLRFAQGAAGAAGVVIGRAVISDTSPGLAAARLFAIMSAVQALGPVVAPLVGGALAPLVGWRGIFGALTAVTAMMAVGTALMIRESLPPRLRTVGGGAAVAGSLIRVTKDRAFLAPALAVAFAFGSMFGYVAASPFVIQELLGFSPGSYSAIFAANAAALALSSVASARLIGRVGPYRLLTGGSLLLLATTAGLATITVTIPLRSATGTVLILVLLFVASVALGQVLGNATGLALAGAGTRAGAGSASLGAIQTIAGVLAASSVGVGGELSAIPMALTMTAFSLMTVAAVVSTRSGGNSMP